MLAALLLNYEPPFRRGRGMGGGGRPNPGFKGGQGSVYSQDVGEQDDMVLMKVIAAFLEEQD